MTKDPYTVLGVDKNADKKVIKSAYRQLAKKYHPDISKEPDADVKFKDIAEAYDILSDETKRAQYDRYGHYDSQRFEQQYYNGEYYRGFSSADVKFKQFKDLSLWKRILIILGLIVFGIVVIFIAIIYLIIRAIVALIRAITR